MKKILFIPILIVLLAFSVDAQTTNDSTKTTTEEPDDKFKDYKSCDNCPSTTKNGERELTPQELYPEDSKQKRARKQRTKERWNRESRQFVDIMVNAVYVVSTYALLKWIVF